MMGNGWSDIGWWGMGIGMIVWVLLLAVIIGFVVWLMNRTTRVRDDDRRSESAEDVLRRRFAGGEIDGEEYEQRLAVLRR